MDENKITRPKTHRFSTRFWTPPHTPSQKKQNFSKNNLSLEQNIYYTDADIFEKIKGSSTQSKIFSHLENFFKNHLKLENLKIEFIDHYSSVEISFDRDETHLSYLIAKSSEYKFKIAMRWEIMQLSIEFKNLYKFFGLIGEQYNFQNSQDFLKFLHPTTTKDSSSYNSKFFVSSKENKSSPMRSNIKIDSQDCNSSRHSESSTESSSPERQRSNFVYGRNLAHSDIRMEKGYNL